MRLLLYREKGTGKVEMFKGGIISIYTLVHGRVVHILTYVMFNNIRLSLTRLQRSSVVPTETAKI